MGANMTSCVSEPSPHLMFSQDLSLVSPNCDVSDNGRWNDGTSTESKEITDGDSIKQLRLQLPKETSLDDTQPFQVKLASSYLTTGFKPTNIMMSSREQESPHQPLHDDQRAHGLLSPFSPMKPNPSLLLSPSQFVRPIPLVSPARKAVAESKVTRAIIRCIKIGNLIGLQKILLIYSIDLPSVHFPEGFYPIHHVVMLGHYDMLVFLANQNLEVEARDENQRTPLQLACDKGDLRMMEYLMTFSGGYASCGASVLSVEPWSPSSSLASQTSTNEIFSSVAVTRNTENQSSIRNISPVEKGDILQPSTIPCWSVEGEDEETEISSLIDPDLSEKYENNFDDDDDDESISSSVDVESELTMTSSNKSFYSNSYRFQPHYQQNKKKIVPKSIRKAASRAMAILAPQYFPSKTKANGSNNVQLPITGGTMSCSQDSSSYKYNQDTIGNPPITQFVNSVH